MALFRHTGLRIIDEARSRIAGAEMTLAPSFTDEAKAQALDDVFLAQRYLRRACDTYKAWQATDHDAMRSTSSRSATFGAS
jgi:hypothetical protein